MTVMDVTAIIYECRSQFVSLLINMESIDVLLLTHHIRMGTAKA